MQCKRPQLLSGLYHLQVPDPSPSCLTKVPFDLASPNYTDPVFKDPYGWVDQYMLLFNVGFLYVIVTGGQRCSGACEGGHHGGPAAGHECWGPTSQGHRPAGMFFS